MEHQQSHVLPDSSACPEQSDPLTRARREHSKIPENLKFSCSEGAVCVAELQPCHVLCGKLRCRLLIPGCDPPSVSRNELGLAVLDQGTKKLLSFPCLQMGHAWKSELESLKSENSDFQSLPDWDSSLDLDVRSWRNSEEVAMGKLEGSSQEKDHEMELSEPLWKDDSEDYQEAEKPCESDNLFQFLLEVTQMLESFCISSTESSQTPWDYCGSGKQSDGEEVRCQEKTTGTTVSGAEENQLHILAEDEKEHFLGREGKTQETPGEPPLGELPPPEMSAQALDQDDSNSTSAAPELDSTGSPNMHLLQPSWNNPLQHLILKKRLLSIWRMIASHRFSSPFLKPVSEKQAPGYKDVVKRPMDLTSIKRRLSKGHIQSVMQFQCDLMLMFQNAVMYNSSNHHVFHVAVEMQREVLEQLQVLAEALLFSRDRLE
ncbi:bromodomain-containing protein 8-like isoform X1 [Corvus hawaiiensis]|uniref:bromodomain-containing protein 8-like isoform X1 n=2 Tax=Corvus hawaiiensis TaxID=134902 RepID=UPI002019BE14|nr:bromodomain-containing protein 8-like isoform X1 [Corvus hawaiiensis]XP_048175804.1 bromodomain-containing protein 8-like isoform X1 [Corvus hawaiiensis]